MRVFRWQFDPDLSWKSRGALILFASGLVGFLSGVDVSERPGLPDEDILTKAYYTLGLFILGGLDLGTPEGGPLYGRFLVWTAYFGAPIWTASAVVETLVHALRPPAWRMRNIKKSIVIFGGSDLAAGFLNQISKQDAPRRVLLIVDESENANLGELDAHPNVRLLLTSGDRRARLRRYPLYKARRLLVLTEDDFANFEFASLLLDRHPALADKVVLHVANLRFLRLLQNTSIVQQCSSFNSYQLAAAHLSKTQLIRHFNATQYRDTVVLAGFGRFGQSILEELREHAADAFSQVAIIDLHAERRALIADEQIETERDYVRYTFQGDIDDPNIWSRFFEEVVIVDEEPVFVLGTGSDEKNLRAAIWLRQQFPQALIISRTLSPSVFAKNVCKEHNIVCVNMTELMEESIPSLWYE